MVDKLKNNLRDVWDSKESQWSLKEDYLSESADKSVVDGKHVLAVIEGIFFVPDGLSRNERFYPKTFWEKVLGRKDVKERLDSKTMLGCIGHSDRSVSEDDITEGHVSHIITNLWIDENGNGMGQARILGTPAGKNLYCIMKAGSKIKISSRASGDYKQDEEWNGYPVIDESTYYLETFDFVINPGFLETDPQLKESMMKIQKEMRGNDKMLDEKFFSELEKSRDALHEKLVNAESKAAVSEAKAIELTEAFNKAKAASEELTVKLNEANVKVADLEKKSNEVSEKLTISEAKIEDLNKTISEKTESLTNYEEIGTVDEIMETVKLAESSLGLYKELGTPTEINEVLNDVKAVLEAYSEFGTYEDVKSIISKSEKLVKKFKTEKLDELVLKISREFKQPVENVRDLLEKVGEKRTVEILKNLGESKTSTVKATKTETTPKVKKSNAQNLMESNGASRYFSQFERPISE